jgi:hypothetical protein
VFTHSKKSHALAQPPNNLPVVTIIHPKINMLFLIKSIHFKPEDHTDSNFYMGMYSVTNDTRPWKTCEVWLEIPLPPLLLGKILSHHQATLPSAACRFLVTILKLK